MKRIATFADDALPFLTEEIVVDPSAAKKHLDKPELVEPLQELTDTFARIEPFEKTVLENALREMAERRGLKPASLIHAVRVAVTGRAASPGLFEVARTARPSPDTGLARARPPPQFGETASRLLDVALRPPGSSAYGPFLPQCCRTSSLAVAGPA